jgi:hypothetical protein
MRTGIDHPKFAFVDSDCWHTCLLANLFRLSPVLTVCALGHVDLGTVSTSIEHIDIIIQDGHCRYASGLVRYHLGRPPCALFESSSPQQEFDTGREVALIAVEFDCRRIFDNII